MKLIKRMLVLTTVSVILALCSVSVFAADRTIDVYLNGSKVDFGMTNGEQVNAIIKFDYAYVPVAKIVEILTKTAPQWDNTTKTATYVYNGKEYRIDTRQTGIYIDGVFKQSVTMTPPVIVNDRTLIPLKMLTDSMGFGQIFDNATFSTRLTTPVATPTPTKTPATPAPPPPAASAVINSISANKTTVNIGEEVTVTISANATTNAVKLVDSNNNIVSDSRKYQAEGNSNIFTLTFKPSATGRYLAYAGVSNTNYSSSNREIDLTVNTVTLAINSVYPSNTSPSYGSNVTVTIETSINATSVWLYNTQKGKFGDTNSRYTDSNNKRTWTISYTVDLNGYQTFSAYARDDRGTEVKKDFNLNVNGSYSSSVIRSVVASPTSIPIGNTVSEITVTTDTSIVELAFSLSGVGMINQTNTRTYSESNGVRTWKTSFYSTNDSGTSKITVTGYDSSNRSYTGEVTIYVGTSSYGYIQSFQRTTSASVYRDTDIDYVVTTGTDITQLYVSTNDGISGNNYYTTSYSEYGGSRTWYIKIRASNSVGGTYNVRVDAYTGYNTIADSRTDTYYVYS